MAVWRLLWLVLLLHAAKADDCANGNTCPGNAHCCEVTSYSAICCQPPLDACCTNSDGNTVCGTTKGCAGNLCCLSACCNGECCPEDNVCCGTTCCVSGCDGSTCKDPNECNNCDRCLTQCDKKCEAENKKSKFACSHAGGALAVRCNCVVADVGGWSTEMWIALGLMVVGLICICGWIKYKCCPKEEGNPQEVPPRPAVTSIRQPLLAPTSQP